MMTITTSRVNSGWHWSIEGIGQSDFPVESETEAERQAKRFLEGKLQAIIDKLEGDEGGYDLSKVPEELLEPLQRFVNEKHAEAVRAMDMDWLTEFGGLAGDVDAEVCRR